MYGKPVATTFIQWDTPERCDDPERPRCTRCRSVFDRPLAVLSMHQKGKLIAAWCRKHATSTKL